MRRSFDNFRAFLGGLCWPGRIAFAAALVAAVIYGGGKGAITVSDPYIQDAGSYLTNDVAHVAIAKRTPLLPDNTEILVYCRAADSTNAVDWTRLKPHLAYADHPYDYQLPGPATNYSVMVAANYSPAPTVHTNGVWAIGGFVIPASGGKMMFPATEPRAIAATPVTDGIYDAEVDYIESPAERGAYFDTGCLVGPDTVIEAKFQYNSATPVQQAAFGLRTTADNSPAVGVYINGNGRFAWCASAKIGSGTVYGASDMKANTTVHVFTLDVGAHRLKIDNNTYNYSPSAPVTRRINDAGLCVFSRANWGLSTYSAYGRLYYCKVYEAGEIAADFLPVRKDGEGCLYDRVSGELFRALGTGAFAVGPDKAN